MKLEMLSDLEVNDVKQIWLSYHEQRSRIADTLTVNRIKLQLSNHISLYIIQFYLSIRLKIMIK